MKYGKVELQLKQGSFIIDSPPVLSGTGETEDITAADTVISADYLNRLCRVNVASGSKIYLPSMNETSDGNRLTVQNISTSNYFWLFQNSTDGYSIDGNDMILVPPRTTVELVFAYEASQWAEIGGRILCTNLIVDIYSDFYNETKLFKILRSLPSKGTNCLLELDFHYDIDDEENPVETIFNVDPVNEEYSTLQIYGYHVTINGINKNYSKIRVNSAKIGDSGVNNNGLFIGIRTKTDKMSLKNFTIQKNFVLTGANLNESHGGLLSTKGCSISNCKFESIVTDSYENTLPALNIRGDVLVRSCSFVDNFGSAVCSVYFGNTVTVDRTSIASTIKQGFRASFGSRIVDGYGNSNHAITPYYKLFGGQIILPNGQAWKDEDDIQSGEAYRDSDFTLSTTSQTRVPFNQTANVYGLVWDGSNDKFTVYKTGYYNVAASVRFLNLGSNNYVVIMIRKNGSENLVHAIIYNDGSTARDLAVHNSKNVYLEDGDYLQVITHTNNSTALTISGDRMWTYFTVSLIKEINE